MRGLALAAVPLLMGFFLDRLLGDPPALYHPVRHMGNGIAWAEKTLRRAFSPTPAGERLAGTILAIFIPALWLVLPLLISMLLWRLGWAVYLLVESWLCYRLLAGRQLEKESMAVHAPLSNGDLDGARTALSRIVGRDTGRLDAPGIVRAAVETVAENASDGVVAPMLAFALGGSPLGFCYKAVNTLDSMVGYKNGRYLHFGRASARLDDFANYIPSRLCGWLMLAAAWKPFDRRGALRVYRRDRRAHSSPNAGQTESVCAGGLGIRLGGDNFYFGKLVSKPVIGEDTRPPQPGDIPLANGLMKRTALLCLVFCCALRILLAAWLFSYRG